MKHGIAKGKISHQYADYFEKHRQTIFQDLFAFLEFQTISADPKHKKDIAGCVKWLSSYLQQLHLHVEVWETKVNPVIFAEHKAHHPNRPTVLLYGHYDVQPVDPLDLWETPPFEPSVRDGEIYARGSADNKGQIFYTICAIKAFLELGKKEDVNIKIVIEGEEEVGSFGFSQMIEEKKSKLKADTVLIVDSGIPSLDKPAVSLGYRGLVSFDVECIGSNSDLHSGTFGGVALNPLRALTQLLAQVWDADGKVAIEGFYDGIKDLHIEDLVMTDVQSSIKKFGITALHHEKGYTQAESNVLRPTFEINGLYGGYSGPGFKTVIPAKAGCKISCRLVPGQDPDKICKLVVSFLKKHIAKGAELKVELGHGGAAYVTDPSGPFVHLVKKAYEDVLGVSCGSVLMGGTLPIGASLAKVSGGETICIGYCFDDDKYHAPNEHFGLERVKYGFMTIAAIFELLTGK